MSQEQKYDINYYAKLMDEGAETMVNPENGLTYHREGDFWIPNIVLEPAEDPDDRPIGYWGNKRRMYLKEHRPGLYLDMLMEGTLWKHLRDVNQTAEERSERMVPEMAKAHGVTEELKRRDQMKWVGMMNNIKASVDEIIYAELIYV